MASIKISKRTVDAAAVPAGNDTYYWDTELKGFGLRVTPRGVRSYVVQYRLKGQAAKRMTLGIHGAPWTPDKAREAAQTMLIGVKQGMDPAAEAKKRARDKRTLAFGSYVERFTDECLKAEWADSWEEAAAILRNHVAPKLKGKALPELEAADVLDVINPLRAQKALARKTWAVLSRLFSWAIEQGDLSKFHNPMIAMKPPPAPPRRKRVLSPDELLAAWRASYKLNDPWGPFVRLLIATLQRRCEVSGLPWKELDRERALWTINGDRVKNDEDHLVPLNRLAMAELEAMGWRHRGLVLTTTGTTGISGFSKMKKALDNHMRAVLQELSDKRAEALGEDPAPVELERWTLHDLRRTGTTGMQALGVPVEHTEAVLNHKEGEAQSGIRKVYNLWKYEPEKRRALNAWGEYLERLIAGANDSSVVTFAQKRA